MIDFSKLEIDKAQIMCDKLEFLIGTLDRINAKEFDSMDISDRIIRTMKIYNTFLQDEEIDDDKKLDIKFIICELADIIKTENPQEELDNRLNIWREIFADLLKVAIPQEVN